MFQKLFWLIAVAVLLGFGYLSLRDQFQPSRTDPRETAALQSIETIIEAQKRYRARYGRYADHLYQLGPPRDGGAPSADAAHLIPADLAFGKRIGYRFQLRTYGDRFAVSADPESASADLRYFYGDHTGTIRQSESGPANESSPVLR